MDFLGDDFRNYFHMQCSWFDSGYVYGVRLRGHGEFHMFFYVNVNSDPEGTLSLSTETGLHSAYCAADREDLTGTVLGLVVDAPVVVQRQVPWFRRYRILYAVEIPQLQFAVAVHRQGLHCLKGDFAAFFGIFRTPSAWT